MEEDESYSCQKVCLSETATPSTAKNLQQKDIISEEPNVCTATNGRNHCSSSTSSRHKNPLSLLAVTAVHNGKWFSGFSPSLYGNHFTILKTFILYFYSFDNGSENDFKERVRT